MHTQARVQAHSPGHQTPGSPTKGRQKLHLRGKFENTPPEALYPMKKTSPPPPQLSQFSGSPAPRTPSYGPAPPSPHNMARSTALGHPRPQGPARWTLPSDARAGSAVESPTRDKKAGRRRHCRPQPHAQGRCGERTYGPPPRETQPSAPPTPERPAEASPQHPQREWSTPALAADCTQQRAGPSLRPCGTGTGTARTERRAAPRAGAAHWPPSQLRGTCAWGKGCPESSQPAKQLLSTRQQPGSALIRQRKTREAQQESGWRLGGPDTQPWAVCCLASGHFCPLLGRSEAGRGRAALPSPALPA